MDLSEDRLTEMLAKSLEKDARSILASLQKDNIAENELTQQSNLLIECGCITPISKLGEMLMEELLRPRSANIVLQVKEERFLCHKRVLSARSEYFKAMLQNIWTESEAKTITLNNTKPEAVAALLCFLYGGSMQIPKFCPFLDVLQISDMFGVRDLVTVVTFHIKTELCHSFHRPCKVCISNAPEVIQLAALFSLNDLFDSTMNWNVKYFCKLWPTKGFASLQSDLRQKCVTSVVESLSRKNAIHLLKECDKLLSSITRVRWTKSVVDMGTELMTSCRSFIARNILPLTKNKTVTELFEGLGWKTDIVESILLQVGDELSVENVSNAHIAVNKLIYLAEQEGWIKEFLKMLLDLKKRVRSFLVSNYYAVVHTESWQRVSAADKMELKSESLDHGDTTRKLSKKPILSSSLNKKPPTPSVLKRQPMKIKPRKANKPKFEKGAEGKVAPDAVTQEQPVGEPPLRRPVISVELFLPGSHFCDVAVGPTIMSHD